MFSVVYATVGSEQIKRAGQAMHESGIPVVCKSDTCVSGTATCVFPNGSIYLWGNAVHQVFNRPKKSPHVHDIII